MQPILLLFLLTLSQVRSIPVSSGVTTVPVVSRSNKAEVVDVSNSEEEDDGDEYTFSIETSSTTAYPRVLEKDPEPIQATPLPTTTEAIQATYNEKSLYPALSTLPLSNTPIFETYIYGMSPFENDLRHGYEMPSWNRQQRMCSKRDSDDFLAQLEHDAMMPNILPMMQIPFARSYDAPAQRLMTSYFPGGASGYAQPMLVSCSPQIQGGVLAKSIPVTHAQVGYEYGQQGPVMSYFY